MGQVLSFLRSSYLDREGSHCTNHHRCDSREKRRSHKRRKHRDRDAALTTLIEAAVELINVETENAREGRGGKAMGDRSENGPRNPGWIGDIHGPRYKRLIWTADTHKSENVDQDTLPYQNRLPRTHRVRRDKGMPGQGGAEQLMLTDRDGDYGECH